MKIVVLGATGGTGLEIVKQSLERGHSVTALVRSPERLRPFENRITVRRGNLLSSADLQQAIQGQDAVLSAFGPRVPIKKTEAHLLERFAGGLTAAMMQRMSGALSWSQLLSFSKILSSRRSICLVDCSFREQLQTLPRWSGSLLRANSIGRWCAHRSSLVSRIPGSTASRRAVCRDLASRFRAQMSPIS